MEYGEMLMAAHNKWMEDRDDALKKLKYAKMQLEAFGYQWCLERAEDMQDVIDFIEKGEI